MIIIKTINLIIRRSSTNTHINIKTKTMTVQHKRCSMSRMSTIRRIITLGCRRYTSKNSMKIAVLKVQLSFCLRLLFWTMIKWRAPTNWARITNKATTILKRLLTHVKDRSMHLQLLKQIKLYRRLIFYL